MKKGFSTINIIIGMVLSLMVLNVILLSVNYLKDVSVKNNNQDYLSAVQLYSILNISYNVEIKDDEINFYYKDELRKLSLINDKIIMSPGTVIYFLNVDSAIFYNENDKIYLLYKRNNVDKKLLIGEL